MGRIVLLPLLLLLAAPSAASTSPAVVVEDAVDWTAYLSRHDPVWRWGAQCTRGYNESAQTIRRDDAASCPVTNCTSQATCVEESASMCDACSTCQAFALSPLWRDGVVPQLYLAQDARGMVPNPDWTTYSKGGAFPPLSNHSSCTVTNEATVWEDAAFYGNGLTGGLVLLDAEDPGHTVRLQVGRTDVADHRTNGTAGYTGSQMYDEPRLPVGSLGLTTRGNITSGAFRITLINGTVQGALNTSEGSVSFLLLAHYTRLGVVLQWNCTGGEAPDPTTGLGGATLTFTPLPGNSTRSGAAPPAYAYNPPLHCNGSGWGGETTVCVQPLLAGGNYATAVSTLPLAGVPGGLLTVLHIANDWPASTSPDTAAATVASIHLAGQADFAGLLSEHAAWWAVYWPASFLSLPDTVVEAMYTLQLYKFASAARALPGDGFSSSSGPAIDLMGPWWQKSGWELYWWDMNVPVTYVAPLAARQFNISHTLTSWLGGGMEQLFRNPSWPGVDVNATTPAPWGTTFGETAGFSGISSFDLSSPWAIKPGVQMGNPTWIAQVLYLHARYTANTSMLRDVVYPLLRGTVNAYLTFAYNGTDGRVHLPPSASPEYPYPSGGPFNDTHYDLALFLWGSNTLLSVAGELGVDDPLLPAWADVVSRLTPFPVNANGYMVDAEHGFDVPHRHFSHLFSIYPLHLVTWDEADGGSPASRDLITRSVDRWTGLTCTQGPGGDLCPNGFTFDGAASMSALMGRPDASLGNLTGFIASGLMHASTLYSEGSQPCFESPPGMATALQEMMLQSWGGRVRVFPSLPYPSAVFHRLGAEGGLAVSALQTTGILQWVAVEAVDYTGAGGPPRVVVLSSTLGPAAGVSVFPPGTGVAPQDTPFGDLTFSLPVGVTLVLTRTALALEPPFVVRALPGNTSEYNFWGKH